MQRMFQVSPVVKLSVALENVFDNWPISMVFTSAYISLTSYLTSSEWFLIKVLFVLIFTDFILGLLVACRNHTYDPAGIIYFGKRVFTYIVSCALLFVAEDVINNSQSFIEEIPIAAAGLGAITLPEILSIIKNLYKLGLPVPKLLVVLIFGFEKKSLDILNMSDEEIKDIMKKVEDYHKHVECQTKDKENLHNDIKNNK